MSLDHAFVANLRRHRFRLHLSQLELASRAGISVSYVSMLERGQRSPPLQTIDALAGALGVPPQKLLAA